MANYSATVQRTNANGSARFDINILYGGVDVGDINAAASGQTRAPGTPEISITMTPTVVKANRLITHNPPNPFEHDSTHLYAKVEVLFDGVVAWIVEIFAQPDSDPTTPHVYWPSLTRVDMSAPIMISETVT